MCCDLFRDCAEVSYVARVLKLVQEDGGDHPSNPAPINSEYSDRRHVSPGKRTLQKGTTSLLNRVGAAADETRPLRWRIQAPPRAARQGVGVGRESSPTGLSSSPASV